MGQTLTNGIYLPDEGERNSYSGLEANWRTLDALILTINGKAAPNIANTWTAAQTFTAGIAGDLTGNVTGTASKAIADEDGTSIKTGYVNVAGNQTVTGDKSFTGSNTFNTILPNTTNTYSLGSSSYQWSSVYAQSYYYNGTEWGLDKANTWTRNNRIQAFLEMQYIASGGYSDIRWFDENNVNCCTFRQSTNFLTIGKKYTNKSSWYDGAQILITAGGAVIFKGYDGANTQSAAFTHDSFYPEQNNAINLGTSTNKWKTINGYEPSALGEVYVGNEVTIDTTNWALDGSAWNTLDTSIMSGWVYFAVSDCDADSFILFRRGSNKAKNPTICFHPQHANSGTYYLYGLFMVPKNTACLIAIKTGTNGVLSQALLYPCFGNV